MHLLQTSVKKEDFIGLLGLATDKYALISDSFKKKDNIKEVLKVPIIPTRIYETDLVGLFCAANSNALILPYFALEEAEKLNETFRDLDLDVRIAILEEKHTAIGNLIALNDKAAIVSPYFTIKEKEFEDILDVEVIKRPIANHNEVGACCLVTNKGFVAHPDAEEQLEELKSIFGVNGDIATVNFGFPFVKSGLIANSFGYLTGLKTTGVEIGKIDEALGFL